MRLLLLAVKTTMDDDGNVFYWIIGQFNSGIKVNIHDYFYDLRAYKGQYVEALLSTTRAPYIEYEKGLNSSFQTSKYFSVELAEKIVKQNNHGANNGDHDVFLTGEFLSSYEIPQKWLSLMNPVWIKYFGKTPYAIHTNDGIIILSPYNINKKGSNCLKEVTIGVGEFKLLAWYSS